MAGVGKPLRSELMTKKTGGPTPVTPPTPLTPQKSQTRFGNAAAANCRDWVEKIREKTEADVRAEYDIMKKDPQVDLLSFDAFVKAPKELKRHDTMVVWDRSRVVLRNDKKASDFIHANYVGGPYTSKDFILSQGPLADTIDDFWWMVWQERVSIIVMLCQCTEGVGAASRQKCAQYWWPAVGGALSGSSRGELLVQTLSVEDMDDKGLDGTLVRLTRLSLSFKTAPTEPTPSRTIIHMQMRNWADMDVPASPVGLFRFQDLVRDEEKKLQVCGLTTPQSPILVHCSAGVGRSGTFVALLIARFIILYGVNEPLDLVQVVRRLRRDRHFSVQTPAQYAFIYIAVLKLLKAEELISPDVRVALLQPPPEPKAEPKALVAKPEETEGKEPEPKLPSRADVPIPKRRGPARRPTSTSTKKRGPTKK